MAMSTLDPDNVRTVEIDNGPTDNAHRVCQTKVFPAKHPPTVGLGQRHQERPPGHIEQPESTLFGDEVQKRQVHPSRTASAIRHPFRTLCTALKTRNGVQTDPKRGFQVSFFSKRRRQTSARSTPSQLCRRYFNCHSILFLSTPLLATVVACRVCICHTQCVLVWHLDLLSIILRPWQTPTRKSS